VSVIEGLWSQQGGNWFCIATKSAGGTWKENWFAAGSLGRVRPFLLANADKDIYFCPHGFRVRIRQKEHAVAPKMLWADLDEADPRKIDPKPTIAIESSPGRYVGLWLTDKPISESMNRKMTYMVGADKGGWDLTQVLRYPGTVNYKYSSKPKVRVIWDDGPVYTLEQLRRKLPDDPETKAGAGLNAKNVYSQYEKHLPPWARRELLSGKPTAGKRSEMLWKLEHAMLDAGMTRDESFVVLKASPWNKFKGRHDEDAQLSREITKIIESRLVSSGEQLHKVEKDGPYKFLQTSLDQVEEENLDWLWYPYLARGELTILEGDPGLGKSYLAQMVAKGLVDGERLPSVKKLPPTKGKVAYFDLENSAGSVTKKRMKTNGCKNMAWFFQEEEPFSIDDEDKADAVMDAIEELKPVLVVFDTVNTYMGGADTHNASETQQAFARFKDIARRYNCAVLTLRHLTKSKGNDKALYRGQGSIAFAGVARVVITVGVSPDEPEDRVMAVTKINVAKTPKALTFRVDALPDTLQEQDRSKFTWGDFVDLTSDDIISVDTKKAEKDPVEACSTFLKDVLGDGEQEASRIAAMAEKRGFSSKILDRTAEALGIVKVGVGFGKRKVSYWSLP
jgi:hypothetical protein